MSEETTTILVVGGSGGLGRAIAPKLAALGHQPLIGWANHEDSAQEAARQSRGVALQVNLNQPANAIQNVDQCLGDRQLAGVVLAGAAPPLIETFGTLDEAALRERLEADLFGTRALLAHIVKMHLKPRRKGTLVAVLSQAMGKPHKAGSPGMAGYVIAKYALAGVCASLGADNRWLRVHTLAPGYLDTSMLQAFDDRFVESLRAAGRIAPVDQVARQIAEKFADDR